MSLTPILTDAVTRREAIRSKVVEGLTQSFPLQLRDKHIEISDVTVHKKDYGPHDQKMALLSGSSLHEPVKGTLSLKDAAGNVVEQVKNFTLAAVPWFTERHTFIIDGNEYNVSNQLRLKPGVYTRRRGNEELEAAFNLSKGSNFRVSLDTVKGHPLLEYGTTSIPLYPVLKKLGVPDTDLAKHWGHGVVAANAQAFPELKHDAAIAKLYGKVIHPSQQKATTPGAQLEAIHAAYARTAMDADVNKETLGHAHDKVSPMALLHASSRLLRVYKDNEAIDDRDALKYKTFHSVEDFMKERIGLDARTLSMKVKGRSALKTKLREIVPASPFTSGLRGFLTGSQLSSIPTHINPMEAIDHAVRVTSLGEGGIANDRAIPAEARAVHNSHLGILDPIRTVEAFQAGINLRMALTAHRDAKGNLYAEVVNVKTGKREHLSAAQMEKAVVAFADQVVKPGASVQAMAHGKVALVPASQVTHRIIETSTTMSPATNLIPFLESEKGNRGIMGGKVQTQALPLVDRDVPWVQTGVGPHVDGVAKTSYEKLLASMAVPTAPVAGTVARVDHQYIYIRPHGMKKAEVETGAGAPPRAVEKPYTSIETAGAPTSTHTSMPTPHDVTAAMLKTVQGLGKTAGEVRRQKTLRGICFKLELEPGDKRRGKSPEGKAWEKEMTAAYGYIPKTEGNDGETVDVYLKEDGVFENVYVVHQLKFDGSFDEDKCMVGWETPEEARAAYEKHGPPHGYGGMSEYDWNAFKDDYLAEHARKSRGSDKTAARKKDLSPDKGAYTKDEEGLIRVPWADHLPFASKTHLHHDVTVKAGDAVHAGQHLGTSNYTKDGAFALGKNLNVAYVPYFGMNSNDAVVISEGAAKKLTSEHMYREVAEGDGSVEFSRDLHQRWFGSKYTSAMYGKLSADGVVKKGMKVQPHDILIAGVRKAPMRGNAAILASFKSSLVIPFKEVVTLWEHDFEGEVVDVYSQGKRVVVTVKTREPMRVGDKLSPRFGNKGVVSMIVPDHKMLQDESGKAVDMLFTPAGVISRLNPAQLLEVGAGKVAQKLGKPFAVSALAGRDNTQWLDGLLKKHDVKLRETLTDPSTGKKLPGVTVGPTYVHRLFKTTETNYAARGTGAYDNNQQPTKGGDEGAKAIGAMEFNALVAHNARNVLREAATIKSNRSDEFWRSLQLGLPLPALKPAFTYDKFHSMLRGAGVNVDSRGHVNALRPLTDADVTKLSSGAVLNEKLVRAKDLLPEKGGLFDPVTTGGTDGTRWSHIDLAEPVVNPVFAEPARRLLGLTTKDFETLHHEKGGAAVKRQLNGIDVADEIASLRRAVKTLRGVKLDDSLKRLKYLEALHKQGLKAGDAYVISKLAVVPPVVRPISPGLGGKELVVGDSNYLYQGAMLHNQALHRQVTDGTLPPAEHAQLRKNLFNAVGAVIGTHESDNPKLQKRNVKGFLEHLTGKTTPKSSFFHQKLMKRQQDVSGRGTIIPDGSLGIDEVGIPTDMLWNMFGKFVIARLVRQGYPALRAKEMVEKKEPGALQALLQETKERPVMVNRAPTLHRYGLLGAWAKPIAGKSIAVNPFAELGTNSDYDGNCFSGSTKVSLTLAKNAVSCLDAPTGEAPAMKFGPETEVVSRRNEGAVVNVELQAIPHAAEPYAVDKNGARSYAVPEGLSVWSYDHATGQPVMAPVTSLTIEDGCEVVDVETARGTKFTASTNESLCVYDHETEGVRDLSPVGAEGKLMPRLLRLPLNGTVGTFDFGWMVGAFLSDGFFMGDREHYYGYTKVSDPHRERFAAAVNEYEGKSLKRSTYRAEHDGSDGVAGSSVKEHFYHAVKTSELFKRCYVDERIDGRASLSKTLPPFHDWSLEARWGLVVGLLDGDGSLSISNGKAKPQVLSNIATSAPALAKTIPELLRTLGIRSSVTSSEPKPGRLQTHTSYTITLSTVDLSRNLAWLDRGLFSTDASKRALELLRSSTLRDMRDLVPVPVRLMQAGCAPGGAFSKEPKLRDSLATTRYSRKAGMYVSRDVARRMLTLLKDAAVDVSRWEQLVNASDVTWDVVKTVTAAGKITVYDLIVPSTKVFAVEDGVVVWDTWQIHTPVLQPAVEDTKKMMLSQLIFADTRKNSLMVSPRMEAMLGIHLASDAKAKAGAKTVKFKTKEEALAAYHRGEITLNTPVEVG